MIKNPEISSLVPTLLKGLTDPNDYTKYSLDVLLQVSAIYFTVTVVTFVDALLLIFLFLFNLNRRLLSIQLMPHHLHSWYQSSTEV